MNFSQKPPKESLFDLHDRPAMRKSVDVGKHRYTFAECASNLDEPVREAQLMLRQTKQRLDELTQKYGGRVPDDANEVKLMSKDDPRWNTVVAERDWRRAKAELEHFTKLREWYRRQADANGARQVPVFGAIENIGAKLPPRSRQPGEDDDLPF